MKNIRIGDTVLSKRSDLIMFVNSIYGSDYLCAWKEEGKEMRLSWFKKRQLVKINPGTAIIQDQNKRTEEKQKCAEILSDIRDILREQTKTNKNIEECLEHIRDGTRHDMTDEEIKKKVSDIMFQAVKAGELTFRI